MHCEMHRCIVIRLYITIVYFVFGSSRRNCHIKTERTLPAVYSRDEYVLFLSFHIIAIAGK